MKTRYPIDAAQPSRAAARIIFRTLLRAIRDCEDGVRADSDPEYLHDFRVAVRRTRAALGQLDGVLPADVTEGFRREFAALGRATGPLRDLDVHLLGEPATRRFLPPELRPGLDPLFARLREQRAAALTEVLALLAADGYHDLLRRWEEVLTPPAGRDLPESSRSRTPIAELASERLRRLHAKLVTRGRAIDATSPDSRLHRLRIQAKKLRYLLEFFAALLPPNAVVDLIDLLKRLQDNLGELNDLAVQQAWLRGDLAELTRRVPPATSAEAAAVGGLLSALAGRKARVRREFAERFAAFADAEFPLRQGDARID